LLEEAFESFDPPEFLDRGELFEPLEFCPEPDDCFGGVGGGELPFFLPSSESWAEALAIKARQVKKMSARVSFI
jgi:hypothetical protein